MLKESQLLQTFPVHADAMSKVPITPEDEELYMMQENMADMAEEIFQAEPRTRFIHFGFIDKKAGRVVVMECLNIRQWKIVEKKKK